MQSGALDPIAPRVAILGAAAADAVHQPLRLQVGVPALTWAVLLAIEVAEHIWPSPCSALGGEEQQQTPEEESEGTRAGEHRSPAVGARGASVPALGGCCGVTARLLPCGCPMSRCCSRCRCSGLSRCQCWGYPRGVMPGARRCLGVDDRGGSQWCRCPTVPMPAEVPVVPVPVVPVPVGVRLAPIKGASMFPIWLGGEGGHREILQQKFFFPSLFCL